MIIEVDENTKFNDIKKCIDIKFSKEIVKFVAKDKLYDEISTHTLNDSSSRLLHALQRKGKRGH